MITKMHLSRRALLRGMGSAIALPMLDAMVPAMRASTTADIVKRRMAFVYIPNGVEQKYWLPEAAGPLTQLPRILAPLQNFKEDMVLLSGLVHKQAEALGDGPGDHARALATYLTGVHCRRTEGVDVKNGVSADHLAAQKLGKQTKFPSLEFGIEDSRKLGICDPGYSCIYTNNLSWRSETVPNPPEINPRSIFERMFGADGEGPAERARRARRQKSILDLVSEDTTRLKLTLGSTDRRKLDEYLSSVREIETRIERVEGESTLITPTLTRPTGVPANYGEHCRLMFDLMTVAFQSNSTRVITFLLGREQTPRTFREIGISDGFHPLTHHSEKPEMVEQVARIDVYISEQFKYFIEKLKSIPEGEGTLLDSCMIAYGAGLGDGNRHSHNDLSVAVFGKALGMKGGEHFHHKSEARMSNLLLSMLDRMGVDAERLGDSTGPLQTLPAA